MNILCMATESCEFWEMLRGRVRRDFINLVCDTDYASIVTKAKNHKPDILIVSLDYYHKNSFGMSIFREGTIFSVPEVWVVYDPITQSSTTFVSCDADEPNLPSCTPQMRLPDNFRFLSVGEMLSSLTIDATASTRTKQFEACRDSDVIENATRQTLLDLGFNACTSGTTYIRECIISVIGINCQPQSLNKTIYCEVSQRNHTTLANLQRCTRTSLETAWRRRKKNLQRLTSGVCFDDFTLCPSVKEFIYYIAYKLNNYLFDIGQK